VYWIYTMAITPTLTYAYTVRWPRFAYKGSRTELSRLHRLACVAITGAKKMAPTAAADILLGLPLLNVMTEAKAQAGICRLMCSQQWKPKFTNFRQARKCWDMEHELILQMRTERMIPQAISSQVA